MKSLLYSNVGARCTLKLFGIEIINDRKSGQLRKTLGLDKNESIVSVIDKIMGIKEEYAESKKKFSELEKARTKELQNQIEDKNKELQKIDEELHNLQEKSQEEIRLDAYDLATSYFQKDSHATYKFFKQLQSEDRTMTDASTILDVFHELDNHYGDNYGLKVFRKITDSIEDINYEGAYASALDAWDKSWKSDKTRDSLKNILDNCVYEIKTDYKASQDFFNKHIEARDYVEGDEHLQGLLIIKKGLTWDRMLEILQASKDMEGNEKGIRVPPPFIKSLQGDIDKVNEAVAYERSHSIEDLRLYLKKEKTL